MGGQGKLQSVSIQGNQLEVIISPKLNAMKNFKCYTIPIDQKMKREKNVTVQTIKLVGEPAV